MNALGLRVAVLLALGFFLVFLFRRKCLVEIDLGGFVNESRQNKGVWIIGIEKATALLREIGFVRFLVYGEEQFFLERKQFFLARVLVKRKLSFIDGAALVRVFHHAQKLLVARLTEFHLEHETTARLAVALLKFLNRFARYTVPKHVLLPHQLLDQRLPFVVLMSGNRRRTADDERRPRFIDENGIDFVDDRIAIDPLYLLLARCGHAVVAQIIETELAVRAVRDVHRVLLATHIGFLIMFNAANR